MTAPPTHPNKEIDAAVRHATDNGWSFVKGRGHAWGIIRCPRNDKECRCGTFCQVSIWSTPRVPENEARKIIKAVDGCMFKEGETGNV